MKKGDVCEGIIERYDFPNKGSFQVDERKVTIKGALPGQKVKYMVTKKKSGMAEGKVLEVLERSPLEDVEPTCPYFGACGGCAYQTMSYDNQLKLKADMVKALLDRVLLAEDSNSKDYEWEGILGSPSQTAYRNKMEFTFGDAYKDGPLALGLHQKGSFYDILTVDGCEIIGADWSRILTATLAFFSGRNVPFFHRMRHEGILRNLVVRQSRANGQFLINLVTSTQWDTYGFDVKQLLQEFVGMLLELEKSDAFAGSIAGILYTENDALGDVVQSDRMELLYGQDYIEEEILGLKFKISPFSFFQTNTGGCEVLYEKARDYIMRGSVKLDGDKTVFDLYSGTGTIAQMMAAVSKKVIGIEIVEEAVEAAKENAKANAAQYANSFKTVVLIDEDKIERMATDEKFRKQYEGILSGAAAQIQQLKTSLQSSGAQVKGYGMQVNDGGTLSFFAVLKKSSADQKARIEKKGEQKRAEKKAAEKKAAKKEKEERLKDKKSDKIADSKEEAGTEDTVTISAGSIEELLSKIETYNFNTRSDSVQTAGERQIGQNFDFRG